MDIPGFTTEALKAVEELLFAEHKNPLAGTCGQKKAREQAKGQRTANEQKGDEARSAKLKGRHPTGNRSEAAKKAAETRRRCRGGGGPAPAPTAVV